MTGLCFEEIFRYRSVVVDSTLTQMFVSLFSEQRGSTHSLSSKSFSRADQGSGDGLPEVVSDMFVIQ